MADKKIIDLPEISLQFSSDLKEVSSDGISYKETRAEDLSYVQDNIQIPLTSQITGLDSDLSGKQPINSNLTGISSMDNSLGIMVESSINGFDKRSISAASNKISISNGDGVLGNPSIDVNQSNLILNQSQITNLISDLAEKQSTTLTSAHLLVGNISNIATDLAMSGDATISNSGVLTLATVNSAPGQYGAPDESAVIITDGKGRVIANAHAPIQIVESQVTNLTTDLASKLNGVLTSAHIFVGNGSNIATDIALSGDATLSNSGVLTLTTVNSAPGQYGAQDEAPIIIVDAKGRVTSAAHATIQITESQVTNLISDLASKQTTSLTSAHLLVGNSSNIATDVAMSGDGSLSNTGILTLSSVNSNVGSFGTSSQTSTITLDAKGRATSASNTSIQIVESQVTNLISDLASKQSTVLTSGHILVGNGSNIATDVAMSSDGTLSNTGALTISNNAITTTKILDSNVTYAKIQNLSATDKLLGRSSLGSGIVEEIACTSAGRSLISGASAAAQRTTLGLGTISTQDSSSVSITGGTIDGTTIGGITPSAATATTVVSTDTTDSSSSTTGALKTAGGLGVSKKAYFGTGAFFPTSGGTATQLDFYEFLTTSVSMTGPFSGTLTVRFSRIGRLIIMAWDDLSNTSTANVQFTGTISETRMRPGATLNTVIWGRDAGTNNFLTMSISSAGVITVGVGSGKANFTGSGTATMWSGNCSFLSS